MSVNAILAVDANFGLGFENGLPWPTNKKDMKWFSDNTRGNVVVMGRKTWESLNCQKLPNRINVVISNKDIDGPDVVIGGDIGEILSMLENKNPDKKIFVIGGADLYRQALPHCDKVYITTLKSAYRCDSFVYGHHLAPFVVCEYLDDDKDMTIQIRSRNEK